MSNYASVSKIHLTDEEALRAYFKRYDLSPVLELDDGCALDYREEAYELGEMWLCSTSSESGWGFQKHKNSDVYFVSFVHQGESIWELNKQSRIHASRQLCVVDGTRLVEGRFSPGARTDTLIIDAEAVKSGLESAQGTTCRGRIEFQPLMRTDSDTWPMLNSVIQCIRVRLDQANAMQSPVAVGNLKQALISTLIETVPHNYTRLASIHCSADTPRHMARAIDYIHEHAGEDILICEVAAYACTSVRNLQLAFKARKNTTPMQYLREVRLTAVREGLLREDVRMTWQKVASFWGFSDMNMFSRYYKRRFGESPYQTQSRIKGPIAWTEGKE